MPTVDTIAQKYTFSYHHKAVADLCIITFFYLLQVGDYTTPAPTAQQRQRTIALQQCDVQLWCCGILLNPGAPLNTLLTDKSATICIANMKNGTKNAVVHHKAIRDVLCPVAALARRLHNIQPGSKQRPISTVFPLHKEPTRVSDRNITIAVRWGATRDGLLERGYTLNQVSLHSLCSGGAIALKLSGASTDTIMRVGRWTSNTYMMYIHSLIGALSKGLAWKMSRHHTFHNVG
jgi:hypothetical protein